MTARSIISNKPHIALASMRETRGADRALRKYQADLNQRSFTADVIAFGTLFLIMTGIAIYADQFQTEAWKSLGFITSISLVGAVLTHLFPKGPFVRPVPSLWRFVGAINALYFLSLLYLFVHPIQSARAQLLHLDPLLNTPLRERSYAEACHFTWHNLRHGVNIFVLAHFLGWFGKALILRDAWFCSILSVSFEVMERSLSHHLPNFQECWWDSLLYDVLGCNLVGMILGLLVIRAVRAQFFDWRGLTRYNKGHQPRAVEKIFRGPRTFRSYLIVLALLALFLIAELNVFFLKTLLYIEPHHPLVITRLVLIFLFALPSAAELHALLYGPTSVGELSYTHVMLLLSTVTLELACILKWGHFPKPFPRHVKIFWAVAASALVIYPLVAYRGHLRLARPLKIKQR